MWQTMIWGVVPVDLRGSPKLQSQISGCRIAFDYCHALSPSDRVRPNNTDGVELMQQLEHILTENLYR